MAIGISSNASEAFEHDAQAGARYFADEHAVAQYESNTGTEIVMKQVVSVAAGDAFDMWLQHIWLEGSGAQQVTPGDGRGLVNHTRLIPSLSIVEQITSVSLPSETDKLAVPTVCYKVRKPGMFPIDDHIALVRFIEDAESSQSHTQTEIVWTIKLTPSADGNAFLADSKAIVPFLHKAVTGALAGLAKTIDEKKTQASAL